MQLTDKQKFIDYLLGAIAFASVDNQARPTKIRLVKFLYLFDFFWAQANQETFTGWPWAFIHYGPYCRESTDAIDRAAAAGFLSSQSFESKYSDEDYRLYSPGNKITERDVDNVKSQITFYVSSMLFSKIKKWGGDTYGLLDYVYFHTGPMKNALPGKILSFDNQEKLDPKLYRQIKTTPISKNKKESFLKIIEKMKTEHQSYKQDINIYDEEYFRFINNVSGDETPVNIGGIAILNFDHNKDD